MASPAPSPFVAFDAYDFANDAKFCVGWENIKKTIPDAAPETCATKLLEAKVFYYSKFFEPIDVNEYQEYMNQKQISAPQDLQPLVEKEKEPLSFSEVMERVEKGEKLPGVEELNIEATNSEITESQCQRVKKPWEN